MGHMPVSVVIPTRNRQESLFRLLRSLEAQTYSLRQVIIVDSSDADQGAAIAGMFPSLPLLYLRSRPHVCVQRNMGIRAAAAEHIFLCDDDIEPPNDYVQNLMEFLRVHPECGAVSGLILEPAANGEFDDGNRSLKATSLLMAFTFQLSLWGDVGALRTPAWLAPLVTILRRFYSRRGNRYTLAGWPLFTQISHPSCRAAVYGLGASIVRRQWLLDSPFCEILDAHGIGDNFGVALGFPEEQPVSILPGTRVKHHKIPENRLTGGATYVRRVLALDYFMKQDPRFSMVNRLFLLWSIFGHYLVMIARRNAELRTSAARVFFLILLNKNPLVRES